MGSNISVSGSGNTVNRSRSIPIPGLKKITVGGKSIDIWPKSEGNSAPITRLQVTYNDDMGVGLDKAGYTKIPFGDKGNNIYLWYFCGSTEYDSPIVDVEVTTDVESEAEKFRLGWERVFSDLNSGAGGNWIHVWVKREKQTYICDVTATDSYGLDADYFPEGYIRMDENMNKGAGANFIWYRQTTDPERALTDLQISTNDSEYQALQKNHYQPVSVRLNKGTGGDPVFLWYKKEEHKNPIKAITLLQNKDAITPYEKAGVTVIKKDLNPANKGHIEFLCVNQ